MSGNTTKLKLAHVFGVACLLCITWVPGTGLTAVLGDETAASTESARFAKWLAALRQEAVEVEGVSAALADAALDGLELRPRVLELQNRQPEGTLTLEQYLVRVVPASRVERGRVLLSRHRELLEAIARKYHVQPRFMVALWGIESDYGSNMGSVPAVGSLATLAFAGRRSAYFRRELLELLKLLDDEQTDPDVAMGSWAGALGQCQFMPSNVRRYAIDWDGDGRRDIWRSTGDVLASTANFLSHLGWRDDQTWGRRVLLPAEFDERLAGREVQMRLGRWQALGVRRLNGQSLPKRKLWTTLLLPDGRDGRAFLVYEDFKVLLRWNNSIHFAVSVGHLSERLR
jgi:membrane-bound lytic murein transglycosylase B